MPDKTPQRHAAVAGLPGRTVLYDFPRPHAVSGLIGASCPNTDGFIVSPRPGVSGASRVLQRLSSCMPGLKDSGGPPRPSHCGRFVLPSSKLRLSASAFGFSKLPRSEQGHFRERDRPCGLQDSLCTLAPCLVRRLPCFVTGPTLHTGGRLTLTRRGFSPRMRRRASLGAIAFGLKSARDRRCAALRTNGWRPPPWPE